MEPLQLAGQVPRPGDPIWSVSSSYPNPLFALVFVWCQVALLSGAAQHHSLSKNGRDMPTYCITAPQTHRLIEQLGSLAVSGCGRRADLLLAQCLAFGSADEHASCFAARIRHPASSPFATISIPACYPPPRPQDLSGLHR